MPCGPRGRAGELRMSSAAGSTSKVTDPTPEWAESTRRVDEFLSNWLDGKRLPSNLDAAIRYAALGPGKRIRPLLVLHSCAAVGGNPQFALAPAAAATATSGCGLNIAASKSAAAASMQGLL